MFLNRHSIRSVKFNLHLHVDASSLAPQSINLKEKSSDGGLRSKPVGINKFIKFIYQTLFSFVHNIILNTYNSIIYIYIYIIYIYIYIYIQISLNIINIQITIYTNRMYIQKLHLFCNTSSPDYAPKSGRKYLGNKQLWKIYQSTPAEYYKINMKGSTRKYVDRKCLLYSTKFVLMKKCCQYIYIYIYIYAGLTSSYDDVTSAVEFFTNGI